MKQHTPVEQERRRSHRRHNRKLVISGAMVLLVALGIGAFIYAMIAWTSSGTSPARTAVDQYYAAISRQQYAAAYAHLDTPVTSNAAFLGEDGYTQTAIRLDAAQGQVTAYSISNVTTSWNFGQNVANVTVHVTRAHQSYEVHLALKLERNTYQTTSFDGI